MKRFEIPEIEVQKFAIADVITVSNGNGYVPGQGNGNYGGDIGGED